MPLSPTEIARSRAILTAIFPELVSILLAITGRPVKLVWDPNISTAATDCKAIVWASPNPFLNGFPDVGRGSTIHEGGHIKWSRFGSRLMRQAKEEGGEGLSHLLNLIMDRRDDTLNADHNPGIATCLRARLAYLCTMQHRLMMKAAVDRVMAREEKKRSSPSPRAIRIAELRKKRDMDPREVDTPRLEGREAEDKITKLLSGVKPKDAWEDFFFACKWHKGARTRRGRKAINIIGTQRLLKATPGQLLGLAKRVHTILGDRPSEQKTPPPKGFQNLITIARAIERGDKESMAALRAIDPDMHAAVILLHTMDPGIAKLLGKMAKQHTAKSRATGMEKLKKILQTGFRHPGPISIGDPGKVKVIELPHNEIHRATHRAVLAEVAHLKDQLVRTLRKLDSPSEFTLYAQDEGDELDFDEVASMACGLGGNWQETVIERDIDALIAIAADISGSMGGEKLRALRRLHALLTEGIEVLGDSAEGYAWAYHSQTIFDLGRTAPTSAFHTLKADYGNSDTTMLTIAGTRMAMSKRRQKILFVITDNGPDNIQTAGERARQLLARGVLVIHIMVDVHGIPDIYPIELPYVSIDDLINGEFNKLLTLIFKHLK